MSNIRGKRSITGGWSVVGAAAMPRHLLVPAVGCLRRGFENEFDVRERYRVGFEPSDRALGEDGFTERHRQPAVVQVHTLSSAGTRPSLIAWTRAAWSRAF